LSPDWLATTEVSTTQNTIKTKHLKQLIGEKDELVPDPFAEVSSSTDFCHVKVFLAK
jgi:hypothetical protein